MKVTISIPDQIFSEAELLAKRLNTSRSDLYTNALGEYIRRRAPDRLTRALNDVMDAAGNDPDGFADAASRQVLSRVHW